MTKSRYHVPDVNDFTDAELNAAYTLYSSMADGGQPPLQSREFMAKFRCSQPKAKMLMEAAKFKYKCRQKGLL